MKRGFIFGAIVCIAVLAAAPIYLGGAIKKDVYASIEQLNKMPGYNAAVTEYNKGWLNSTAKINIAFDVAALQGVNNPSVDNELEAKMLTAMSEGITLALDAQHGLANFKNLPALSMVTMHITLDEANADVMQPLLKNLQEKYSVQELIVIDVSVPLFGEGIFNITMPAMTSNVDNTAFTFAGLNSSGTFSDKGKHYNFSGVFGEIALDSPNFRFKTSDIVLAGKGTMAESFWISYGTSTMRMERLYFSALNAETEATEVTLQNLAINTDVKSSGEDMLSMLMDLDIAELNIPGYTVRDIDYDLSLSNLRESALMKFYEQIEQLQAQASDDPQEIMDAMKLLAKDFVSAGPALNIDKLGYTIDELNYLALEGGVIIDAAIAEQAIDSENPMAILSALSGNMTMEFGEQLFQFAMKKNIEKQLAGMEISPEKKAQIMVEQSENIMQMSKQFVDQGMLQKINNGYRVDITYQDSVPLINGNPFNMF